jgi:hydrogenase-1 operon protein HyaE
MSSPLIKALIDRHAMTLVTEASLPDFLAEHGTIVLFFTGDPGRVAESDDVAVILPEILKLYGNRLTAGLVDRESERALQRRFHFNAFPSLVFLNSAGYLGALSRVLDWNEYLSEIPRILASEPGEPPAFALPNGCAVPAPRPSRESILFGDPT